MSEPLPREVLVARNTTRITWTIAVIAPLLTLLTAFIADDGSAEYWIDGADQTLRIVARVLIYLPFVLLLPMIVAAYVVRSQRYKAWWYGDSVQPRGYILGNNAFFALVQFPAVMSTLAYAITSAAWPYLLPLGVCLVLMVVNFPHGKPMRSVPPRVGHGRVSNAGSDDVYTGPVGSLSHSDDVDEVVSRDD